MPSWEPALAEAGLDQPALRHGLTFPVAVEIGQQAHEWPPHTNSDGGGPVLISSAVVGTLIAVFAGWLLSEMSQLFRERRNRKSAAGVALAELLEIRYYLQALDLAFREMRARAVGVPVQEVLKGMTWLEQSMPPDPGLPERYERAVSAISGSDPILGFQLRNKAQLPAVLTRFRALQLGGEEAVDLFASQEFLHASGLGGLEDAIRDLAWAHGLVTWIRVRVRLRRPLQLPEEVSRFFPGVESGNAPEAT